ncbi:hypothetical protein [Nonomuraea sp. 10N515B]|uniref:hypothetical protein n=1 Tax=Nonomuraea sp. 10N515B TaxID=3457422 RepID=UPI003FCD5110
MERFTRRMAAIIGTALLVSLVGVQPAWADYDVRGCRTGDSQSVYSCQTGAIIPHNSELWIRVGAYTCGSNQVTARLRHAGTLQVVATFTFYGAGWESYPVQPACADQPVQVKYGLAYQNYYYLEVTDHGTFYAGNRICNFTYNPSNGNTC